MSFINNLKIRVRLLIAFGFVMTLMTLMAAAGYWGVSTVADYVDGILAGPAKMAEYSARARANTHAMRQYEKDMFMNLKNGEKLAAYYKEWKSEYEGCLEKINDMDKVAATSSYSAIQKDRDLLKKMREQLKDYYTGIEDVHAMILGGKIATTADANTQINDHKQAIHGLAENAKELAHQYNEMMAKEDEAIEAVRSRSIAIIAIFLGVASVFSIVIALIISASVAGPVAKGLAFSQKIASGDFTERIDITQKDEIGQLGNALNKAADNLEKLIAEILVSSQNLSQAVEQIASGNENLSQRTSEQASALEEVASTIEEATAAINQNAENSQEGKKVAMNAVQAIREMNDSSVRIAEIIGVINDIAFQTNLLALNAAVEAARAGEQGRGFAVVAGEVRNLAQRSGNAAKEIEGLIKDAVAKVGNSTVLVDKTGSALAEIAAASMEQRQGMAQINTAISEMDSMTQQNASLVEETASASEEMANQAQDLMEMVQRFNISNSLRDDTYSKKHRELTISGIQKKRFAVGNGRKTIGATAAASAPAAKTDENNVKMKDMMKQDGFEEF